MAHRRQRPLRATVDLRREPTLDLRDDPNAPPACPSCGGSGYLDRIDMRRRVRCEHCKECGCTWERSIDDDVAEVVRPS